MLRKKKKLSRGEALGFKKKGVPTFGECIVFLYSVSVSSLFHGTSFIKNSSGWDIKGEDIPWI